ncbi:MAG: polysaccharide deacetylase family protein [Candidatus Nanopelagicales bacterium]|nr:polysaccharide deacetylase family protein [Candidatus Nanopelagicales bacterium]MDZ4249806.1 polysaccharide deacetylase family protein [Candidatus Nanopelagicales bacterium]
MRITGLAAAVLPAALASTALVTTLAPPATGAPDAMTAGSAIGAGTSGRTRPAQPTVARSARSRLVSSVKTRQRVVFLTIDDGYLRDPALLRLLRRRDVPATAFLSVHAARNGWAYWRRFGRQQSIQNHTISHPWLARLSLGQQEKQICNANRAIRRHTTADPWMMRPPYGEHGTTTMRAAATCGIKYVVMWSATLTSGLNYQVGNRLRSGDIILAHFNPGVTGAIRRALNEIDRQGFRVARLEEYLPRARIVTS